MAGTPAAPGAMAFSVPKDIQNHPVRNVDRARQREMWWSVVVGSLFAGALLLVAWEHSQWREIGYALDRLQQERLASEAENRHLRLELATLREPKRIEGLATAGPAAGGADADRVGGAGNRARGRHAVTHARRAAVGTLRRSTTTMNEANPNAWQQTMRGRVLFAAALLAVWAVAIEARLVWLQVYQHEAMVAEASAQKDRTRTLMPRRGDIVDRHGRILAISVDAVTICGMPKKIDDPAAVVNAVCEGLGDCTLGGAQRVRAAPLAEAPRLGVPPPPGVARGGRARHGPRRRPQAGRDLHRVRAAALLPEPGTGGARARLRRRRPQGPVRHRADLQLQGQRARRAAPSWNWPGTAARSTPGSTRNRSRATPSNSPSTRTSSTSPSGNSRGASSSTGPRAARSSSWTRARAKCSRWPTIRRSTRTSTRTSRPSSWLNRAVQEIYEPGSTFKVVTASAAMEEGVFTPDRPHRRECRRLAQRLPPGDGGEEPQLRRPELHRRAS